MTTVSPKPGCPGCLDPSELQKTADEIRALSPAAQLRLAADLIELHKIDIAHAIASRVVDEMALVIHMTGRVSPPSSDAMGGEKA